MSASEPKTMREQRFVRTDHSTNWLPLLRSPNAEIVDAGIMRLGSGCITFEVPARPLSRALCRRTRAAPPPAER